MAKEKNSFVLYYDLEDILLDLSDSQIAELFRAIFAYEKRGEAYSGSDPEVKIAMRFVSRALDDNDERYRANIDNGYGYRATLSGLPERFWDMTDYIHSD